MFNIQSILARALLAIALAGAVGAAGAAPTAYRVEIDASTAQGAGLLSFTLAGIGAEESGIALLHNFSGAYGGLYESNGGVDGSVGSHVELVNMPGDNFFSQNVTFGGTFSFDVQFDFATTGSGILFSVASYLPDYADTALTADGNLLGIEVGSSGEFLLTSSGFASITSIDAIPFEPGTPPVTGIPPYLPGGPGTPGNPGGPYQPITPVPEPGQWLLLGAGLLLIGGRARMRRC